MRKVQGSNLRGREPDLRLATGSLTTRATFQAEGGGIEPPGVTLPRFSRPVADHSAAPSMGAAEARPVSRMTNWTIGRRSAHAESTTGASRRQAIFEANSDELNARDVCRVRSG